MLDGELVPSSPQRPANSRESHPEQPFRGPDQTGSKIPEVREGGRVPSHVEPRPDTTPDELCQHTFEKDVIRVLHLTTQHTPVGPRSITFTDLISRRQPSSIGLPQKDLDLRRNTGPPNQLELGSRSARDKLSV